MRDSNLRAFIGTYTVGTESQGIYALDFRTAGMMQEPVCVAVQKNPAFLLLNEARNVLYAVEESFGASGEEGGIWSYRIRDGNQLQPLNRVGSLGVGPCCLCFDQRRQTLFTANFHSGSLTSIRLREDGSLGDIASHITLSGSSVHPERQSSSHPHAVVALPGTSHVLVTDLGADTLSIFALNATNGALAAQPSIIRHLASGSGPRHVALHTNQSCVYVIHEIASTITVHRLGGPDLISDPLQSVSLLSPGSSGIADAADIVFDHANARLYASVRQTGLLHSFSVDPQTGLLTALGKFPSAGASPHALGLSSAGNLLLSANLQDNSVAVHRTHAGPRPTLAAKAHIPAPASIAVL